MLGLLQMLLYAVYRNCKTELVDDQEKKHSEDMRKIVILSTLATSDQVYPVDNAKYNGDHDVDKVSKEHDRHHDDQKTSEVSPDDHLHPNQTAV